MSNPVITPEVLDKIANLAHISLTPEEKATFIPQLETIFEYVQVLNTVDTTNIKPTFQVNNLVNQTRLDESVKSMPSNLALAPAAKTDSGYIVAPKTISRE